MSQSHAAKPASPVTPTPSPPPIPRGYAAEVDHGFDSDRARLKGLRGHIKRLEATLGKLSAPGPLTSDAATLTQEIKCLRAEVETAQMQLVPWHHDEQLLSPKSLLCSPLFGIARSGKRREKVEMTITHTAACELTYQGPELRQSDGLVFMALLHLAQDFKPGRLVFFSPVALLQSMGTKYAGGSVRHHLQETIQRLQESFLKGPDFRVQLVGFFHYPPYGDWSIRLDEKVTQLFEGVQAIWMDRRMRTGLPPGLATWLLGYIRSQAILNTTSLSLLQSRCGSLAKPKNFADSLREALSILEHNQVVEPGWRVMDGKVTWKKGENG